MHTTFRPFRPARFHAWTPLVCAFCAWGMTHPAAAQNVADDDVDTSAAARNETVNKYGFSLAAPDLYQIDGGAECLTAGDFNGDDLVDFVCVNNEKNLFYFFYQKSKGARRFERTEEPAEAVTHSIAAADFNNDGRTDLAFAGAQSFVRYQDENGGKLGDPRELEEAGERAIARDFDGDELMDLMLVKQNECFLLRQGGNGAFERPARISQARKIAGEPLCFDINNDGLPDLVWRDAETPDQLVVRRQVAPGAFDAEIGYRSGYFADLFGSPDLGGGGAGFVCIESKTLALEVLRFASDPNLVPGEPVFGHIRLLPMLNDAPPGRETFHLATGVLQSPGEENKVAHPSLFVLAEGQPSLEMIDSDDKGRFVRQTKASLLGARKLLLTPDAQGAAAWLWVLSPDEQTIGAARVHPAAKDPNGGPAIEAGFDFPQLLNLGSKPLAFDIADMDSSASLDLVYASTADDKPMLSILSGVDPANLNVAAARKLDLQAMNADYFKGVEITDIKAADVNRDRRVDLLLFTKYDEVKILVQDEKGEFAPLLVADSGVQEGLFKGLKPEQIWVGDVDGDGLNELLAARERFARLIKMNPDATFEIVHQFNGKSAASQISAVAAGDVTGDGRPEIMLLDRGAEKLVTIYSGSGSDYKVLRNLETDPLTGAALLTADLDADGTQDIVIASEDRLGVIFPGRSDAVPQTLATSRSEVEDGGYRIVAGADLIEPAGEEFVALENREHLLEFYRLSKEKKLERFYKFKVFGGEGSVGFRSREAKGPPEPSEIVFADFDGDKRKDMAVLVHEKAIIYLRQDPPAHAETANDAAAEAASAEAGAAQ